MLIRCKLLSVEAQPAGFWFGGNYAAKADLWHEASPINYVGAATPPVLFINSSRARFGVGRNEMIEKMQPFAIPYRVEKFADAPHSFWLFNPWLEPTANVIADFLNEQFNYCFICS